MLSDHLDDFQLQSGHESENEGPENEVPGDCECKHEEDKAGQSSQDVIDHGQVKENLESKGKSDAFAAVQPVFVCHMLLFNYR